MARYYCVMSGRKFQGILMEQDVTSVEALLLYAKKRWGQHCPQATWEKPRADMNVWYLVSELRLTTGNVVHKKELRIDLLESLPFSYDLR